MSEFLDEKGLTEAQFLATYNANRYPKPSLTADILIFADDKLLLIERKNHPFIHRFALPGGFADKNEAIEETAKRELKEETGLEVEDMDLVGVFSAPGRDPRGWVVSVAFQKRVAFEDVHPVAGDDARNALWFTVSNKNGILELRNADIVLHLDDLAFDHGKIVAKALELGDHDF